MSKIKQLIDIDNNQYDMAILTPDMLLDDDLPDKIDWAIVDLLQAIETLETIIPYGYINDIEQAKVRLTRITDKIEKPF
jgi:hypothetical protein